MSDDVRLGLSELVNGVRTGDRSVLGQAITLVESTALEDRELAVELIAAILPDAGNSHRIGITGVPGVGKSSFIEVFGIQLIEAGHRVAVLAIDPSSARSGGSILGDKTRMPNLARDQRAFIRPSPSGGTLGGVARHTREAVVLCEAAGHDVILIETVGVGQSETVVANMVDFFVVLMLARGGDELQGIKRGVLELADLIAVTKADGDNVSAAKTARRDYEAALRLMQPRTGAWKPPVVTCSALERRGISAIWDHALAHRAALESAGEWTDCRRKQGVYWMWAAIKDGLVDALHGDGLARETATQCEAEVLAGTLAPDAAAAKVLEAVRKSPRSDPREP